MKDNRRPTTTKLKVAKSSSNFRLQRKDNGKPCEQIKKRDEKRMWCEMGSPKEKKGLNTSAKFQGIDQSPEELTPGIKKPEEPRRPIAI